jgi:hypothetical protein
VQIDDFIRIFARELRDNSAAVMCGAGVSIPSGLPSWKDLLEPARVALKLPRKFSDLTLLATYYVSQGAGSKSHLKDQILEKLGSTAAVPNGTHRALWALPVDYIWSLNFDDLLEKAIDPPARVISSDQEMQGSLGHRERTVIKIHGGISDLRSEASSRDIVLSRDDFDSYLDQYPRTWARLLADFHTKSMLFVGISFADPNMQQLLRLVRMASRKITQQHFAIFGPTTSADTSAKVLRTLQLSDLRRGGVEVIELDNFDDLPDVIERLAVAARPANVLISGDLEPDDEEGNRFLEALGVALASETQRRTGIVHGGGIAGSTCADAFSNQLESLGLYSPERVTMIRRRDPKALEVSRHGNIVFTGPRREDVLATLCNRASIVIAIGGSDGTEREMEEANRQNILVVPLPVSPGAARTQWEADSGMRARLLHGKPVPPAIGLAGVVAKLINEHLYGEASSA